MVTYSEKFNSISCDIQIELGMSVTPERIPVLAKFEDGNTSDKTWNLTFIKKMRETLNNHDSSNLPY